MKKVIIMASFAAFVLSSCKKDYTCTCKVGGTVINSRTIKDTKKKAEADCNEGDISLSVPGFGTVVTDCSI